MNVKESGNLSSSAHQLIKSSTQTLFKFQWQIDKVLSLSLGPGLSSISPDKRSKVKLKII